MLVLTKKAYFLCPHGGRSNPRARQGFVFVDNSPMLVRGDPVGRKISGCTNIIPPSGIKPCITTLKVLSGHSAFISIKDRPICISSVEGFTDGTPPGTHRYKVHKSGQNWVRAQ